MLIQRPDYLNFLIEWKEQQIIKVITVCLPEVFVTK